MTSPIHTIGHSNHDLSTFLSLLEPHNVTHIVDIRSTPSSRYVPHFNQTRLRKALQEDGINYTFMGNTLGGRPPDPNLYDHQGRVNYDLIRHTQPFQEALAQLLKTSDQHATAILCTEKDPLTCHRTLLVAAALETNHHDARHITSDGDCISHRSLIDRLTTSLSLDPKETQPHDQRESAIRFLAAKHAYVKRT